MLRNPRNAVAVLAMLGLFATHHSTDDCHAAVLTVDGDPTDWGFNVADNNASTFVPNPGLNLIGIDVDDDDDFGDEFFVLGPGWGGQDYDSEALAAAVQNGNLYVIVVTGQRPDNGFPYYAPGDLIIRTVGQGTYGIEIGGGPGGGPGGVLTNGMPGSTYTLSTENGLTLVHEFAAADHVVGSIWHNPTWLEAAMFDWIDTQMVGGDYVGEAELVFTRDTFTTQHAVIELAFPLSLLNGATISSIEWYPACGNDLLGLSHRFVPEPSSFVLAALALLGLAVAVRRRG